MKAEIRNGAPQKPAQELYDSINAEQADIHALATMMGSVFQSHPPGCDCGLDLADITDGLGTVCGIIAEKALSIEKLSDKLLTLTKAA